MSELYSLKYGQPVEITVGTAKNGSLRTLRGTFAGLHFRDITATHSAVEARVETAEGELTSGRVKPVATLGPWRFLDEDCKRAGECVCGFCKRDGSCDFADCRRPAEFNMFGQGNGRPACKRCAHSGMVTKSLGYRIVSPV